MLARQLSRITESMGPWERYNRQGHVGPRIPHLSYSALVQAVKGSYFMKAQACLAVQTCSVRAV